MSAAQVIGGCVSCGDRTLSVVQRQLAGRAGGRDVSTDVDVAIGIQSQRVVGAPTHRVVDVDVATAARTAHQIGWSAGGCRCCLDLDVVTCQQRAQRCAGDVAAGGCDREVKRVNQPVALQAMGCSSGDCGAVGDVEAVARSFDAPAVAAGCATHGLDAAVKARDGIGVVNVRPDHGGTRVAGVRGVDFDLRALGHRGRGGLV